MVQHRAARARLPGPPLLWAAMGLGVGAWLLLPGSSADKLRWLAAGICAQRPGHSYFLGDAQLPLEARMGGIFAGFLVGVLYLLWASRERAALLPTPPLQALLLGLMGLMAVDGVNALVYDLGGPALKAPQNALRLATGLLCGLALALLAVPVLAGALWRDWDAERSLESPAELAGPLCLLGILQIATTSGAGGLLLPLGLLMVGGAVVAFGVGNSYAVLLITRAERRATTWREASSPLVAGMLIAVLELVALAALRYWAEAVLGVRWPV